MSTSQAGSQITTGLWLLTSISLAYSVGAVLVRERFGRPGLLRWMAAAAVLLFAMAAFSAAFHAAGAAAQPTLGGLGFLAIGVLLPLGGTTWIVSRQRPGVRGAAWIGQSLGAMLAFWAALALVFLPALLLDVIRFLG